MIFFNNYTNMLLVLIINAFAIVNSVIQQTKFLETIEIEEIQKTLGLKFRNLLTEFYQLREGDINFYVTTRENRNLTKLNETNLNLINPNRMTKFIVGGWIQNYKVDSMFIDMANAYLHKGNYNIIIVDNHKLMYFPIHVSMTYVEPIGNAIGRFIVKLQEATSLSLNKVHIIGHSLGGNVASFAGKEVIRLTGLQVYRITGLDSSVFPFKGLNKDDAEIVDAIHTTATVGLNEPIGNVDFFPNGGGYVVQPGCSLYPVSPLKNNTDAVNFVFCNHHKSYQYFIQTINLTIKAVKCSSFEAFKEQKCRNNELSNFGDNYALGSEGTFYLYLNCTDTACTSSYM